MRKIYIHKNYIVIFRIALHELSRSSEFIYDKFMSFGFTVHVKPVAKLLNYSRRLIRALQDFSALHPSHIRLYHQITSSSGETARQLAEEIEGLSSRLYTRLISRGRETGTLRRDMDPGLFAFFFDNLLMMLQFSYCCDYYRARMELYCGGLPEDSAVEEQLLRFLESAFTFERSLVPHGDPRGEND